jgi:enoyl-CoA hydratase/carnithine racemase
MTAQAARAPTPQPPILLRETLGSVGVLTLNRPEARNSLSEGLIAQLHAALKDIHDDTSVRAVVIAANGPAFSSGHDMKELTARRTDADLGRAYFAGIMTACRPSFTCQSRWWQRSRASPPRRDASWWQAAILR